MYRAKKTGEVYMIVNGIAMPFKEPIPKSRPRTSASPEIGQFDLYPCLVIQMRNVLAKVDTARDANNANLDGLVASGSQALRSLMTQYGIKVEEQPLLREIQRLMLGQEGTPKYS